MVWCASPRPFGHFSVDRRRRGPPWSTDAPDDGAEEWVYANRSRSTLGRVTHGWGRRRARAGDPPFGATTAVRRALTGRLSWLSVGPAAARGTAPPRRSR